MKKHLLLICSLLLIGFSACDDDDNVQPIENPNTAFVVTLDPDGWVREANSLIAFDIPLQDLTEYYMLQGGVAVALSFDNEQTYDVLPTTFAAQAYSVNYSIGMVTIYIEDPIADDDIRIEAPSSDITAKIILTTTDYLDYQGLFDSPDLQFKELK
ncbi:hypothetical protein [Albibacterium indicum]|uniref:hypothetical protein n=1 Tax=Albibacterium indicum TaxID=2292082 RepID=UPI000E4F330A|nr:hypothetical protein [Pedobacter indicus]